MPLAALLIATSLLPQDSPEAMIDRMRAAYAEVKAARWEVMVKHPIAPGERATTPIVLTYQAPKRLRIDLDLPSGLRYKAVTDGATVSIENYVNPAYVKPRDAKNAMAWFPLSLESRAFIDFDSQLTTKEGGAFHGCTLSLHPDQEWNGKRWTVLQADNPSGKVQNRYFVDPKTFLIWQTEVRREGAGATFAEHRIVKIDLNPSFAADHFALAKPPLG